MDTISSTIDSTRVVTTKVIQESVVQSQCTAGACYDPESVMWICLAVVICLIIICTTIYLIRTNNQKRTVKKLVKDYLKDNNLKSIVKETVDEYFAGKKNIENNNTNNE